MISAREAALSAFFGLFEDLDDFPTKARRPSGRIDFRELPAIVLVEGGAQTLGGDDVTAGIGGSPNGQIRLTVPITVNVGVRTLSDEELPPALNAARATVLATIGAAMRTDCTLGNRIDYIRYNGDDDPIQSGEEGAPPHAVFPILFSIIMTEAELDPYSTG